jgi:hypothetical protein
MLRLWRLRGGEHVNAEGAGSPPTEEELRAAYEAQVKQIRVEQIVLENVVTVLNLGMRRTGLSPGTEDERDLDQVRVAIESVRAQLPLLEQSNPDQVGQIRDALSQLQMAYVRIGGQTPAPGPAAPESTAGKPSPAPSSEDSSPPDPEEPGPAQRSGRLWVPGQ